MATTLELLQAKLTGTDLERFKDETALLEAYIFDASVLARNTKYPFDESKELPNTDFYKSWIVRAALEMLARRGAEGETSHSENGLSRSYDSTTVSKQLLSEITPQGKYKSFVD